MSYNFQQSVQMGHRLSAIILFLWTIVLFVRIIKEYKHSKVMVGGWAIALSLIVLQALSGILSVYTMLSLYATLSHALFISCYFGMLSYYLLLSNRSAARERHGKLNHSNKVIS